MKRIAKLSKKKNKVRNSHKSRNGRNKCKPHYSRRRNLTNKRGGGYGGNPYCNDPNFSIFNTNLLKLFPYSPLHK
jgi:hypothetical protein